MAGSATLVLSIVADTRDAVKGLNDTENATGKFKGTVDKLALPAAAAAGALLALGKSAATSASDQQQAMGSLDSVYGPAAAKVKDFASKAATAVGLSKTAYATAAAAMGASLKSMGFDQNKAAEIVGEDDQPRRGPGRDVRRDRRRRRRGPRRDPARGIRQQ